MLIPIDSMDKVMALATALAEFEKAVCTTLDGQLIHLGKYTITIQPRNEALGQLLADDRADREVLIGATSSLLSALVNALPPDFSWKVPQGKTLADAVCASATTLRGLRLTTR